MPSTHDFGFPMQNLDWASWVPVLDLDRATPDEIKVLEESHPKAKTNPYYLLLVQEAEVLRQRSKLFNTIMYGPRGASRAERELAATAESRMNGCPYCAAVHALRYVQMKGDADLMARLMAEGVDTPMAPRPRAIVDFAVRLAATPPTATAADVQRLRDLGLDDAQILDIAMSVAMFANANRLMQTLGEAVHPAETTP